MGQIARSSWKWNVNIETGYDNVLYFTQNRVSSVNLIAYSVIYTCSIRLEIKRA